MRMKNANVFFILGGTNVTMGGGTQNFWDWGTGLQGGDNLWMGGGVPLHTPHTWQPWSISSEYWTSALLKKKYFLNFFCPGHLCKLRRFCYPKLFYDHSLQLNHFNPWTNSTLEPIQPLNQLNPCINLTLKPTKPLQQLYLKSIDP